MPSPIERKLAAIMFTDIAGYTEAMSKSESKTLNLLEKKRSILKPLLKEYKGTFVKEIGDGTLSYFESAVNAATCAVKLQENTYDDKEMNIRVGIHIGDIVFKDGDVFGGGVNVASRLESIAPAGGVIVSKSVFDELINQEDFEGIELGLQCLKGVGRLIEVFGLKGKKLNEPNPKDYQDDKIKVHSDDEVPSIAIITFENKGKEEDAFYAYGISVDLISDVTSAGLIRVASKKQIDDVGDLPQDELAKKLDVRYMANGELWRMGDMFQLSIELYDTKDKQVVWSDRWQENWDDLPAIKNNLSDGLLKTLDAKKTVEKKKETANPEAYEFYLKGVYRYKTKKSAEDIEIARGLLLNAINLDGNLLCAHYMVGVSYREQGKIKEANKSDLKALSQARNYGDNKYIAIFELSIGNNYAYLGDDNNSIKYYLDSAESFKSLNDWRLGYSLLNISNIYLGRGDTDNAMIYNNQSLKLMEESDDKNGIYLNNQSKGNIFSFKGNYNKATKIFKDCYNYFKEINDSRAIGLIQYFLGINYFNQNDYLKSMKLFSQVINFQQVMESAEIGIDLIIYFALNKKILGEKYEVKNIKKIIVLGNEIEYELNYHLNHLLNDSTYLQVAYKQVQEKANNLGHDVKLKFLSYPIPKAIGEEWDKVK